MKKMKPKGPKRSMRLFLTIFVTVELLIIDIVASLVVDFLDNSLMMKIPKTVWIIIISLILGSAITMFLAKFLFDPVVRLGEAMRRVSQGDFSVRLETNHMFPEIRQINENFNLMAQELSSTEILKTEFVSNVSHEFKTPINAIEGYATLLQGVEESGEKEQQIYVDKILFNTRRLSKLVGNILLLSKVDNQEIRTGTTVYRLDEQIRQSLLALEPSWSEKGTEFDVNLQRVDYTGNESLLTHVWDNLIENAIKYGPHGGLVSMTLTQNSGLITFVIEDSGPGIPEDALQHIFDRFYQADSSRKAEGNGLGLALVKQILSISGGTIRAENIPGGGARFIVELTESGLEEK